MCPCLELMKNREYYKYYISYVLQNKQIPRFLGETILLDYEIDSERDLNEICERLSWRKSYSKNDIVIINWKLLE